MESQIEQLTARANDTSKFTVHMISYDELIISGSNPESLDEIKRKQNEREGLTNITDNAFQFFTRLENVCRTKLTHFNLVEHGKNLFNCVENELLNESALFSICINLFTEVKGSSDTFEKENSDIDDLLKSLVNRCENYIELFDCIVLFLRVAFSQFRGDYLFFVKKEKGKALRKGVHLRNHTKMSKHLICSLSKRVSQSGKLCPICDLNQNLQIIKTSW